LLKGKRAFMTELSKLAETVAKHLTGRKETIAVAESSAGGLIAAALLEVPGASAYFLGGVVAYTYTAREEFLKISAESLKAKGITPSTEAYALVMARAARDRLGATWGVAETGTAGPTGSRYGYNAGRACVAVAGPVEASFLLETGVSDRPANMRAFASAALDLLARTLAAQR
jgi:nicotinamide-nucleotide amidase